MYKAMPQRWLKYSKNKLMMDSPIKVLKILNSQFGVLKSKKDRNEVKNWIIEEKF